MKYDPTELVAHIDEMTSIGLLNAFEQTSDKNFVNLIERCLEAERDVLVPVNYNAYNTKWATMAQCDEAVPYRRKSLTRVDLQRVQQLIEMAPDDRLLDEVNARILSAFPSDEYSFVRYLLGEGRGNPE